MFRFFDWSQRQPEILNPLARRLKTVRKVEPFVTSVDGASKMSNPVVPPIVTGGPPLRTLDRNFEPSGAGANRTRKIRTLRRQARPRAKKIEPFAHFEICDELQVLFS